MSTTAATLHLARVLLPYETAVKRDIHDPYQWHQRAWDAYPGHESDDRNFLTRIDQKDAGWQLLLLSSWQPQRPDWCPDHPQNWGVRPLTDSFLAHPRYHFSLRANPVRRRVIRDPKTGERKKHNKREPITNASELDDWLRRQATAHGFELIVSPRIDRIEPLSFRREKDSRDGIHHLVDFSGVLRPTDSEAFHKALASGIGPAKAFGFGMLCLSPLS